jgi:hypothetical protein
MVGFSWGQCHHWLFCAWRKHDGRAVAGWACTELLSGWAATAPPPSPAKHSEGHFSWSQEWPVRAPNIDVIPEVRGLLPCYEWASCRSLILSLSFIEVYLSVFICSSSPQLSTLQAGGFCVLPYPQATAHLVSLVLAPFSHVQKDRC